MRGAWIDVFHCCTLHKVCSSVCFRSAILSAAVDGSEVTQLTAIATDSITISCDDFSSNAPQSVEWLSDAWSTSHDLVTIFRSNPNFDVMSSHVNAKNYEVDRQYRLTIVKVNKKEDPGKYICRITTSTGDVLDREYHLDVGGMHYIFFLAELA